MGWGLSPGGIFGKRWFPPGGYLLDNPLQISKSYATLVGHPPGQGQEYGLVPVFKFSLEITPPSWGYLQGGYDIDMILADHPGVDAGRPVANTGLVTNSVLFVQTD